MQEEKCVKGGVICKSVESMNHHYDTLKPDTVLDVKDLPDEDISSSLKFANGQRKVVITQMTFEKANYIIKNFDSLFKGIKIPNLYFDPYNDLYGMDARIMMSAITLGECCKKNPQIENAYFIIREGTYCRMN